MNTARTQFQAIGTHWEIQVLDPITDADWQRLTSRIHARIASFDKVYSRFRADSLVTKMSQRAGTYKLPADGFKLLQFYEQIYHATNGKVTPLIGQVVADAGYDASYSFQSKTLEQPAAWEDVLAYSHDSITLKRPTLLDFGAAGKGYLVDIIGELMHKTGVENYVINAGGDILHRSATGQAIEAGLENPQDTSEAIGIVQLENQSLCASAGSKRKWGNYHHIIDPTRLHSPRDIIATWVIAQDTITADGLATALFFTDAATLEHRFTFTSAQLSKDMQLSYHQNFPVKLFETTT